MIMHGSVVPSMTNLHPRLCCTWRPPIQVEVTSRYCIRGVDKFVRVGGLGC